MADQPRVLIAEDEVLVAMHIARQLGQAGFTICSLAATAEQVVQIAQGEDPHIVLLDIRLAGKTDGLEAARRMRAFTNAPIIFMTGYMEENLRQDALQLQPADYLFKPVELDMLEALIRRMLAAAVMEDAQGNETQAPS